MINAKYYLLSASVSGIKNIHKCIKLNFYKKTVDRNFDPGLYRIKGIFGENGFGKTAIMTSFSLLKVLVLVPESLGESRMQEYLSNTINKSTEEFSVECEFLREENGKSLIYKYRLIIGKVINRYQIIEESLCMRSANPSSKYIEMYSVKEGSLVTMPLGSNDELWKSRSANQLSRMTVPSLMRITKDLFDSDDNMHAHCIILCDFATCLFVSLTGDEMHENQIVKSYDYYPLILDPSNDVRVRQTRIPKDKYKEYVKKVARMAEFLKLFKPELKSIDITKKDNGDFYSCDINFNYGNCLIDLKFESAGIKRLVLLYDAFCWADEGGIVLIDELDVNINSIYLNSIIEYMMLYGKGQFIFTSHNIDVMNVLKDNKMSIDFLNSDQEIVQWITNGNKSPINAYKNGLIKGMPYNIGATDFVGVFGEE